MREAIRDVIERHRKEKLPLAIWDYKKGKVVYISPEADLRRFNKETGQKKQNPMNHIPVRDGQAHISIIKCQEHQHKWLRRIKTVGQAPLYDYAWLLI